MPEWSALHAAAFTSRRLDAVEEVGDLEREEDFLSCRSKEVSSLEVTVTGTAEAWSTKRFDSSSSGPGTEGFVFAPLTTFDQRFSSAWGGE